jgi:nitric oxide synthase-interacting protein
MAQKIVDKRRFESTEYSEEPVAKKSRDEDEKATSKTAGAKDYRSFWVPELSTTAEPDKVEKPSGKVLNPMNGKPLKFKDLMPVVFTPVDANEASTSRIHSMKDRYKCPITGDILTNSCRAAYLKTRYYLYIICLYKILVKE